MRFLGSFLVASLMFATGLAQTDAAARQTGGKKRGKHVVRRRQAVAGANTQTIGIETAAPTAATAQSRRRAAAQNAADQRLLEQQQAQSAEAGRVNDQIVKTAQQRQDRLQREVRIQDAPGPAQTGVVPAAGTPVAPASSDSTDTRIQDAPGPAQTLPVPASPQGSGTQPQTSPQL